MKHITLQNAARRPAAWLPPITAILLLLAGCSEKKAAGPAAPQTVPVSVATATVRNVPLELSSIGNVQAFTSVMIKSQVNGIVTAVHFTQGQDVKQGDLLFTLDRRPFEADLARAQAQLAKDQADLANARAQAARFTALLKEGVVSAQQAEQMTTNAAALEAAVNADKAQVEYSRVQLQYTQIYAPISGRTGDVLVHPGNVVKANDVPVLVSINQVTPIYAEFSIPEQNLADVKKYMALGKLAVRAMVADGGAPVEGTLTFVDNAVDPQTGTIKLKGTFANTERRLWPGQFVNLVLTLAVEPNALVVPSSAIQNGQNGPFLYVVRQDNTVQRRDVMVERTINDQTVVRSGLQAGETVVTDGQLRLQPDARVDIKSAVNAPPAGSETPKAAQGSGAGAGAARGATSTPAEASASSDTAAQRGRQASGQ